MKKTLFTIWMLLVSIGLAFPNLYGSILDTISRTRFGSVSFPTSLDSLENPTPTQSVATAKSHSQQHSDANDAIEALEGKMGIGASTPTNGTVFYGNGSGSSAWSASPSLTGLTLSGQGIFGSFISNASSTITGGLTITGNSTTTNATSTIGAFTNYATSTKWFGGGLGSCSGGNFITWVSGVFGCEAQSGGATIVNSYATSSNADLNHSVSVILNDQVKIWGNQQRTNCQADGGSVLALKYSIGTGATTTVMTASETGDANPCNVSVFGMITAPGSGTIHIKLDSDNGGNVELISLMTETDS